MKKHLWDGNIDCGWEELQYRVVNISNKFASDMLEIVSYSPCDITKELINQETMERFRSLCENLSEQISNGEYCEYEDIENTIKQEISQDIKYKNYILLKEILKYVKTMRLSKKTIEKKNLL